MLRKLMVGFLLVVLFGGCIKKEPDCNFDECELVAPANEVQAIQNFLNSSGITATKHCSGMFYVIDSMGTGNHPGACTSVRVTYSGSLTNGTTFDSGTHDLGLSSVIRGWTIGVPLIRQGGRIRLFIPPTLGYGYSDYGPIPANSILIFDITLVTVY
jgi:FKBP-type peptidyl-prolyl cis-trans isomerase FkpA